VHTSVLINRSDKDALGIAVRYEKELFYCLMLSDLLSYNMDPLWVVIYHKKLQCQDIYHQLLRSKWFVCRRYSSDVTYHQCKNISDLMWLVLRELII